MDDLTPVLTPEERAALRPQRPPERFAERVMGGVTMLRQRSRRRRVAFVSGVVTLVAVAAAAFAIVPSLRRPAPEHGDVVASARTDVRAGDHVVAVLEPGAHVAWDGDTVTQLAGDVFYRFEPGGTRRVRTPLADVIVRGTCFDVKIRNTGTGGDVTRREAVFGAAGALASAAVLVGVYEGKVTLARATGSVDVASGQAARVDGGGIHGPQEMAAATANFESSAPGDPWSTANANLVDQVRSYQRRLDDSQAETRRITHDLDALKTKLAQLEPDAAEAADPFNPTQEQWKDLARAHMVRAKNFCFPPPDWHPSPQEIADLGLSPDDVPTLTKSLADASQRMWQSVGPACAKIVGSLAVAERLGNETCGTIIRTSVSAATFSADTQLVADIRARNKPMPPPGQLDGVVTQMLAMTGASSELEKDLTASLGPDQARRIAYGDVPWGCALQFGGPGTDVLPQLGQGTQQ